MEPTISITFYKKPTYTVRLSKTNWGTLRRFMHIKIKGPDLKALRYTIKLVELYCVAKSFWKYVLIYRQHKSSQRPPSGPNHTKYW